MQRIIVHLDADAFFASVEQAADTRLRGKPVAVGGEKRGIIASASYEARKFGVYTPMPTVRARKLCPKLVVIPGDFEKYEWFSRRMFSYAQDFTPDVEIASIDEGYFDLSGVGKPPVSVAETVRDAIRQSLKISVSEGIASNKLVSQVASKLNKPAAFTRVSSGDEIPFLHPLPNCWLPGVGPKTGIKLNSAGLARIGQIAQTPLDLLSLLLGSQASCLKQYANGIDERPVVPLSAPAKSYGHQRTFESDVTDEGYAEAVLRHMADDLMATVRADGKAIRTVTVKVRYNDMAEDQCGDSLPEPTDLETDLYGRIHTLFRQAWKRRVSLRMVALKLSNVYDGIFRTELALDRKPEQTEARRRLAAAVDGLRRDHGHEVILRGHDFQLRESATDSAALIKPEDRTDPERNRRPLYGRPARPACVPLGVRSYYSFLNSTLPVAAVVELAKRHQLPAVALTDEGNLHGAVELFQAARAAGIKPILGAEAWFNEKPVWLYVENTRGYRNLCRLLSSQTSSRAGPDEPVARHRANVRLEQLDGQTEGLLAVCGDASLQKLFPGRFYLGIRSPEDLRQRDGYGRCPCAPMTPVHYAEPGDRWKFDVIQSIRTLTLLRQSHPEKTLTGDFHFIPPEQARMFWRDFPDVPERAAEIADRCSFDLPMGRPQFPAFVPPDGSTSAHFLRSLVLGGLQARYSSRAGSLRRQVEEELSIIRDVGYEDYFLIVWDILQECRSRGISWITRGSAADSLVCYCLGISGVCPIRFDLYFRRFLNKERMALNKLPDIDMDFPHDRKDDVVDLIFKKYGPDHAAVVGGFSTFQARSAVADVAKVLGVSEYQIRRFTGHFPWTGAAGPNTPRGAATSCQRNAGICRERGTLQDGDTDGRVPRRVSTLPQDAPVRHGALTPADARADADVHVQQGLPDHALGHGFGRGRRPGENGHPGPGRPGGDAVTRNGR